TSTVRPVARRAWATLSASGRWSSTSRILTLKAPRARCCAAEFNGHAAPVKADGDFFQPESLAKVSLHSIRNRVARTTHRVPDAWLLRHNKNNNRRPPACILHCLPDASPWRFSPPLLHPRLPPRLPSSKTAARP